MKAAGTIIGKLYVCATPIGNLKDITLRVLQVLQEADLIAAEDTRHTRKLLAHYDIHTSLTSYNRHNTKGKTEYLIECLVSGSNIALVSDAGTPGVSDPGEEIIRECIDRNIDVVILPGPSAIVSALVVSGMPTNSFVFEGFLPRTAASRKQLLVKLAEEPRTMVFYEAPHRLKAALFDISAAMGHDRRVAVCRELTKKFEEIFRGTVSEAWAHFNDNPVRGELVLVVHGREVSATPMNDAQIQLAPPVIGKEVDDRLQTGMTKAEALRQVAAKNGLRRRDVYGLYEEYKAHKK